ncbi:myo-inositol-1 phosphatase [Strigomonas culicis]|uniref:Myo-inositol-1 phosphatase n=1 Tax=Strigomonas culicis TaxID=28005 RepID=S9UNE9_9TRYP|nr:myo-inositol-1 phosphatase [Strigomonas culicis]|eukprot:EPY16186.1 myo-inositol-1 phosphatase [Strigomonas culicis]
MSFVHGLPDVAVSIALLLEDRPLLAVVFCPFFASGSPVPISAFPSLGTATAPGISSPTSASSVGAAAAAVPGISGTVERLLSSGGELFTAVRGRGCYLNGRRVEVNTAAVPAKALMVMNIPYGVYLTPEEAAAEAAELAARLPAVGKEGKVRGATYWKKRHAAIDVWADIRRQICHLPVPGTRMYLSCVATLVQLAAGRVDLYIEPAGKLWDVAAATLCVEEAGGVVSNLYGNRDVVRCWQTGDTSIVAGGSAAAWAYGVQLCRAAQYGQFYNLPFEEDAALEAALAKAREVEQQEQQ